MKHINTTIIFLMAFLFLLTHALLGFDNSYELLSMQNYEPSLAFQIVIAFLFVIMCLSAYLLRVHGVNKKNKQLYELNTRLILEVNERRKTEKNLISSKQRFIQLSQATFEAIFIVNKQKIIEINQSAVDMFGYPHNELVGMSLSQLVTPVHKEAIIDVIDEDSGPYRATGIKKDNSVFFVELRGKNINYDNKRFKVLAVTDITDKVEADNQKEVLEQQLRQAQKMEAVGNLAGGVAHDFNNMLQVIMGFSEMALKKLVKDDPVAADISQIVSTTEKAAGLTKKLMTFSRKQTYQPKVLDLNALIVNLENILSGLMESDIAIEMNLVDDIPRIYADPGQVEQVLINLIVNARDAVNENRNGLAKKIEIQTSTLILDDNILTQHIDMLPVDHICIKITDNGCGMPEEIQQRVYEPFFTTKPEGKGTGLGLSTVYGIIKQNNAIIDLVSKVNHGTTFKIYWPSTDKVFKELKEEKIIPGLSQGSETILLVEDEEGIRNFAVVSLQQNGYKVFTAENGKKALQMIEDEHIEFDLLISDLHMPGMDGDELIEMLQKKMPDIKTIVMSGYGDDIISHNGLLKGQINFLQKPFLINTLLQKVRSTLDRN